MDGRRLSTRGPELARRRAGAPRPSWFGSSPSSSAWRGARRCVPCARSRCSQTGMCIPCAADRGCTLAGCSEQSCRPDVALNPGLRPATGWAERRRRAGREPVEIQPKCALPAAGSGARLQQDPSPALHLPPWQVRCAECRSTSAGQMGMLWSKAV